MGRNTRRLLLAVLLVLTVGVVAERRYHGDRHHHRRHDDAGWRDDGRNDNARNDARNDDERDDDARWHHHDDWRHDDDHDTRRQHRQHDGDDRGGVGHGHAVRAGADVALAGAHHGPGIRRWAERAPREPAAHDHNADRGDGDHHHADRDGGGDERVALLSPPRIPRGNNRRLNHCTLTGARAQPTLRARRSPPC